MCGQRFYHQFYKFCVHILLLLSFQVVIASSAVRNSPCGQGQHAEHIDASPQYYAVLSKQHKATELLSIYLITSCWNRESETVEGCLLTIVAHSEEIHIEMLGQEVMLWEPVLTEEVKYVNKICNSCGRTSIYILLHFTTLKIFNYFNWLLWNYMNVRIFLNEDSLRQVKTSRSIR